MTIYIYMSKYKKEDLEEMILNKKLSYESVGSYYGVSGSAIKKAALRLGISLEKRREINESEHFNKGSGRIEYDKGICLNCGKEIIKYPGKMNKYCSSKCQQDKQHKDKYELFLSGNEYFQRSNYNCDIFKPEILKEQNGCCDVCGFKGEWNEKKLVFILDHIDGDASNNKRGNLRLVCPNCDSQLPTYKSKNKNSARKQRYLKKL
jgi:hypothetical protein